MKKYRPYLIISAASPVIGILLSKIFDFSATNTWQASVIVFFMFAPLLIWVWKLAKHIQKKHPAISFCIRTFIILCLVDLCIVAIATIIQYSVI